MYKLLREIRYEILEMMPLGTVLSDPTWRKWKTAARIRPYAELAELSKDPIEDQQYRLWIAAYFSKSNLPITTETIDAHIRTHGRKDLESLGFIAEKSNFVFPKVGSGGDIIEMFRLYARRSIADKTLNDYCTHLFKERFSRRKKYNRYEIQLIVDLHYHRQKKQKRQPKQTVNVRRIAA